MNTRRTHTPTALAAAAALTATLTGCNASADARPTETIGRCTECTVAPTPTPTSTTLDAAAQEKADRAAAEVVWRKFSDLIFTLESVPVAQVDAAIDAVSVEPMASHMREVNADYRLNGKVGYGVVVSYITWTQPIDSKSTAALNDCQDGSQAGIRDAKTGNKVSVGTVNTPMTGTLVRTNQGWKVKSAALVQGASCTTGE